MRILDRYVCREVLSHTLLGLAVFSFIFFVPRLVTLMSLVVRHASNSGDIAMLVGTALLQVLPYTLPISVLVGVLIGLGRLSADSEIVAMNASGIGLRRLLLPIAAIASGISLLTLVLTLWLGPASLRMYHDLEYRLGTSQASYEIQPRVFDERFPHMILYVQDVDSTAVHWRGVFLAESNANADSHLTLAEGAIVVADAKQGKLDLHLSDGSIHQYDVRDPQRYGFTTFGAHDESVALTDPTKPRAVRLSDAEQPTRDLLRPGVMNWRDGRVEFNRRIAFPAACLVFALLGVPVGAHPRRGGRAAGFVLTLLLVTTYYFVFVTGAHLAQQGTLPPFLGMWAANLFFLTMGLALLRRIEKVHAEGRLTHWLGRLWMRRTAPQAAATSGVQNGSAAIRVEPLERVQSAGRAAGFPLLIDLYILRTFFYFFVLMLAGFILLFDAFTLFDLLGDITQHHVPVSVVLNYLRNLLPMMFYNLVPLAALVATLVTLGVMSKSNEITAFKASGISLYRLSLPLLLAGLALSAGLFLLDDTILPYANQRQDALRNQIKGRPAQTYFQPAHQWIVGENEKFYNYEVFDPDHNLFGGLNVFELDPATFQVRRRILASRARWEPHLGMWVLETGWIRDFEGGKVVRYVPFQVSTLDELTEQPGYFKREIRQSSQMNWRQLERYISDLGHAGFDTARLSVQWHKKFAFPLMAPIIIFLAVPFAFLVGTRGATGGLALAVGIGLVYWVASSLFEAMGGVGQLPSLLAGWAPDAIFAFLGLYSFLKMPT
jgi:LPS export ABC transporter permease LptF/LPS export ABC transporter permease LptG